MKKKSSMLHNNRERHELAFDWPSTPFGIVLVEPVIPPNTGNIARLCAATGTTLHLIKPLGFNISEKEVRRAGLDYWDEVDISIYNDFDSYIDATPNVSRYFFTTSAKQDHADISYPSGSHLIFGSETHGLSDGILERFPDQSLNIPIQLSLVRSLNLANAASIALYTALRNRI